VKSFARIHETNLKARSLGLTFANERITKLVKDDTDQFIDLVDLLPGKPLSVEFVQADGSKDVILANHTYNAGQIDGTWLISFKFDCCRA
jgi:aconitate hydratase